MINLVNNNNIDKSILEQVLNNSTFHNNIIKYIRNLLEDELKMVLFTVTKIIESNNNLLELENLYHISYDIIDEYKALENSLNDMKGVLNNEKLIYNRESILQILMPAIENKGIKGENEIVRERNEIVTTGIREIHKNFLANIGLGSHYQYEGIDQYDTLIAAIVKSYEQICKNSSISGNQTYIKTIKNMNTVESRHVLTKYMEELVKRRREIAKMLEFNLKDLKGLECTGEEYAVYEDFLLKLSNLKKEVGEKESTVFGIMNKRELDYINDKDVFSKLFLVDLFEDNIKGSQALLSIFDEYQLNKYKIIYELYGKISSELNVAMNFGMKEIFNDSDVVKLLSCDIVKEMKIIKSDIEGMNIEEIDDAQEMKIVGGIMESLQIKYDTLKTQNNNYTLTKKEDIVAYEKRLMDYIEEIEENLEVYFKESVEQSSESFLKAEDQYNRIFRNIKEINLKYDKQHLKNDIFSEINTYDDIVRHSATKLLESEQELVKNIGKRLVKGNKVLFRSIEIAGIHIIEPKIGDKFDGNRHEIITAKAMENYEKGTIYEVFSKGYEYMEQIVIRANVSVSR